MAKNQKTDPLNQGELPTSKPSVPSKGEAPSKNKAAIQRRIAELRASGADRAPGYVSEDFVFDKLGKELRGKILDFREYIGKYESKLIVVESQDQGHPVNVWLSGDLKMKIRREHVGRVVTILYVDDKDLGMGNDMRVFEVFFEPRTPVTAG